MEVFAEISIPPQTTSKVHGFAAHKVNLTPSYYVHSILHLLQSNTLYMYVYMYNTSLESSKFSKNKMLCGAQSKQNTKQ